MSLALPTFRDLRSNYPMSSTASVISTIGGGISPSYVENGCILRMCIAFNYLGNSLLFWQPAPEPFWNQNKHHNMLDTSILTTATIQIHAIPKKYHYIPAFTTTFGRDGKRYCFRVDEFFDYLNHKYKKHDLNIIKLASDTFIPIDAIRTFKASITGKTGIICFKTKFDSDAFGVAATGHFTLWDGQACLYGEFFEDLRTHGIFFWRC